MELVVGRVVKPHGVRGELVVEVRTDAPEERFVPGGRLIGRLGTGRSAVDREVEIETVRPHLDRLLVRLAGVDGREAAEAVRGMLLLVDSSEIADTGDPDEFHDHQLVGLRAVDVDGADLGEVTEVAHTAAGELLTVALDSGGEALVPFMPFLETLRSMWEIWQDVCWF